MLSALSRLTLLAMAVLLPSPLFSAPPPAAFVGVVYNVFHEEYATDADFAAQVDKDIPAIAQAGFTHVLLFPMNQWDPSTRRRLWTRTDHLISRIEEAGLKFVPLMLKEEQCSHYFPIWKFREMPEFLKAHQRPEGGRNTRENVDFADPRIFPLVEDNFRAVAERYGRSSSLAFYNIWNEPHYGSDAEHVVVRFRSWLQSRYGSLEALRRAWGEDYTSWEEVSPFLNDDWNSSLPAMDWRLFRGELNGRLLGELAAALRRYDPVHPINANPVGAPWASGGEPGGYNTDNWQFTPYNDFNGLSYYPDAYERDQGRPAPLWLHNLSFTVTRCASAEKGFVLTELYTNAKNGLSLDGYLDEATMTRVSWTAFANDAKGIIYWKWEPFLRGRQSLGRGLVRLDGTLAPRGQAAADFARQVSRHATLLRESHPVPAQVGILVDQAGLLKVLDQPNDPRTRGLMSESLAGVFRALDQANIPCDVLRSDLHPDAATLARYRVLFLPFQVMMRRELAPLLADYVSKGGTLVADARTATIDELDFAYRESPGAGLAAVFGVERLDWVASTGRHAVAPVPGSGISAFQGKWFREKLRLQPGTEVLATFVDDASPALTLHRHGSGAAVLSAVLLGASGDRDQAGPLEASLVALCQKAGVVAPATFTPAVGGRGSSPSLRVHKSPEGLLVYAINGTDEPVNGSVEVDIGGEAFSELLDLRENRALQAQTLKGVCRFELSLPARGVLVTRLRR